VRGEKEVASQAPGGGSLRPSENQSKEGSIRDDGSSETMEVKLWQEEGVETTRKKGKRLTICGKCFPHCAGQTKGGRPGCAQRTGGEGLQQPTGMGSEVTGDPALTWHQLLILSIGGDHNDRSNRRKNALRASRSGKVEETGRGRKLDVRKLGVYAWANPLLLYINVAGKDLQLTTIPGDSYD